MGLRNAVWKHWFMMIILCYLPKEVQLRKKKVIISVSFVNYKICIQAPRSNQGERFLKKGNNIISKDPFFREQPS